MEKIDIAIIGGGIIGLTTAYNLIKEYPQKRILIFEKEDKLAFHQSGRNSGVLHSGIYYKPGSLKAQMCREGKKLMEDFCKQFDIKYDICGKVIVAVEESELDGLRKVYQRGKDNGVTCEIIDCHRLQELEPHASGIKAISVPEAGIVNYKDVCHCLAKLIRENGHQILLNTRVEGFSKRAQEVIVKTNSGDYKVQFVINCAGLHSDRVASYGGDKLSVKIIPFRGEYYFLKPEARSLCQNLVYPVPDSRFPFLGVHFTRRIEGGVECGPNAVLAFSREGYNMTDIRIRDIFDTITYPGFIRLSVRYWKEGVAEMWRSCSKRAFVKALQKLIPEVRDQDLIPASSGVRAQAVSKNGDLVDDFCLRSSDRVLHVLNAPSPAATASLSIGRHIVKELSKQF